MSWMGAEKHAVGREELAKAIGGWLQEIREDAMLSAEEVAKQMGCHQNAIRQLERGIDGVPSVLTIRRFMKACGAWQRARWAQLGNLLIETWP